MSEFTALADSVAATVEADKAAMVKDAANVDQTASNDLNSAVDTVRDDVQKSLPQVWKYAFSFVVMTLGALAVYALLR